MLKSKNIKIKKYNFKYKTYKKNISGGTHDSTHYKDLKEDGKYFFWIQNKWKPNGFGIKYRESKQKIESMTKDDASYTTHLNAYNENVKKAIEFSKDFYEKYETLTENEKQEHNIINLKNFYDEEVVPIRYLYDKFLNYYKKHPLLVAGTSIATTFINLLLYYFISKNNLNKNKHIMKLEINKIFNELKLKDHILLEKISKNPKVFSTIDKSYKTNEKFILKAIKENVEVFNYIDINFKTNEKFILKALKANPELFNLLLKSKNIDSETKSIINNYDFLKKIKKLNISSLNSQIDAINPLRKSFM